MKRLALMALLFASTANAQQTVFFSTGNPDGRVGMASRPASALASAREAADDFLLLNPTSITGASFYGLLAGGASAADISQVTIELYRVFPLDSDNPPSGSVATRVNSPSDVVFDSRTSATGLTFSTSALGSFSVANSVVNGILPAPNSLTGGEGPVTGMEVSFAVNFLTPFVLPADHYFFVPQVTLTNGTFLWLSASRPIGASGTPFTPDLQTWMRSGELAPDWLRVGTDIIGGQSTFNGAFSLSTVVTPEPSVLLLFGSGLLLIGVAAKTSRW
jgi:hypothetical protein